MIHSNVMRYIIVMINNEVFKTNWYTHENCWSDCIFCVIDTINDVVTFDGSQWNEIDKDHL